MDKIHFNSQISSEYKALNEYAKKRCCQNSQINKIKESAWGSVFLVRCQKPSRRFILKCSTSNAAIKHEYACLSFLKNRGITNVPRVIAYEKCGGYYVLCLNFIENTDRIDTKGQEKLARILAKVHSIKVQGKDNVRFEQAHKILTDVSSFVDYLNRPNSLSLYKKSKKLVQLLDTSIEHHKIHFMEQKGLVFVNGDMGDDSIYYCDGKISIIDWHASGFADNAWDIARLFLNNPEVIDKKLFLKEYLMHIKDKDFMKRFEIYWPLNKLFTLLYFFFKSEWYGVPMRYGSRNQLEENLGVLLKSYSLAGQI